MSTMGRPRTLRACDHCKRRKIRCNGQPFCQQCIHSGLTCIYAAPMPRRSRIETVGRGKVIAECRGRSELQQNASPAPATSIVPSTVAWALNPTFFTSLLLEYTSYVYPMSPVIPESEVKSLITQMNDSPQAASFVYAFAAVTFNLTRDQAVQQAPETREHIATLLTHSIGLRSPVGLDTQPTLVDVMSSVFTQVCLVGLRKLDLGFFYLREAISLLYMLKIDSSKTMDALEQPERARRQRAYWECFIHERFTALTCYKPTCLTGLPELPVSDDSISPEIQKSFNLLIENFRLVDGDFLEFWLRDPSAITVDWIESKQRQLENDEWHREVLQLPLLQQADLIITRHWLRTLTWQMALSNTLLSSTAESVLLSLSFPIRLSNQLHRFLKHMPRDIVGIHGSGILEKLFEITNTITDVLLHLAGVNSDQTVNRIHDILFLRDFIFSFGKLEALGPDILKQKFETIREKYPEIKEMELLM